MSSRTMGVASPAGLLVASALHWIIWTRTGSQAHTPFWELRECDKSIFRRNLDRVCAVYKRSAAEYFLAPLLNAQGQFIFQDAPYEELIGFYLRTPLNADPATAGFVPGMAYFFNAPMDFGVQPGQGPGPGGFFFPGPGHPPMFNFATPFAAYLHYTFGTPIGGPGFNPPRLPHDPDPFRRWRRQAVVSALLVKCCNPSGCNALDFIRVDKEYNICEK